MRMAFHRISSHIFEAIMLWRGWNCQELFLDGTPEGQHERMNEKDFLEISH